MNKNVNIKTTNNKKYSLFVETEIKMKIFFKTLL